MDAMSPFRRTLLGLTAALAVAVSAYAGVLEVGGDVPDVAITMADGTETKLSGQADRTVVLYFYGTWMKRAGTDAAAIDGLRKAREKQKLTVIGVARDAKAEDAKKFGEDQKLGFPQAADPKGELYKRFAEKGLPYVVVIDGKRKLRYSAGGVDTDAIEAVLVEQLGKRDPAK